MNKKNQIAELALLSTLLAAARALTFINLLPATAPAGTTMGSCWLAIDRLVTEGAIEALPATPAWPVEQYAITAAGELRLVQLELDTADWL